MTTWIADALLWGAVLAIGLMVACGWGYGGK